MSATRSPDSPVAGATRSPDGIHEEDASAYMISRGLAKAGSRHPYDERS